MVQKNTILIVDDHTLFRAGLKAIIARETRYEVVGEAGSGREALKLVRNLRPDLILLDMALPDRSGIELIQEIKAISPDIRIMIVSMHSKIDYIVKAFQAGATGYVVKESAPDRLLEGMNSVLHDDYFRISIEEYLNIGGGVGYIFHSWTMPVCKVKDTPSEQLLTDFFSQI